MFLFKKKSESRLGVDIGNSAVKVVEMEREEGRFKLKNYGIFPLNQPLAEKAERSIYLEPLAAPAENLAEAINRTIKEAKIEAKQAYFSVPVYSSFTALIKLPPMPQRELASVVAFEAKKYVPVPIAETVVDWSAVNLSEKETEIQILLVAVLKETIEDYNKIVRLTGLKLAGIETETFALTRVLAGNDKSSIILVDTGARSSNISIVDKGFIREVHNLELGGIKITRAVSRSLGISQDEAERLKLKTEELKAKEAINSVLDAIILEVKKAIDDYQKKSGRRIEKCVLTGGGLNIPGGADYFKSKLNIETTWGNPFARVAFLPILEPIVKELGPSLAVATGLAMR